MFKVSKKPTSITCQIYIKLTIKTPEQCLVLLLLTLKICSFDSTVTIAEFERINVGWAWETLVSMFSVTVRNIFIVCKGVSSPTPIQNYPSPISENPPSPPSPPPPTLLANPSSQALLINRNSTVKLSSINTIHV